MFNKELALKGCICGVGVCVGMIIGGEINEKLNQKYVVPSIERWKNLATIFSDELNKAYKEIDELKKTQK